MRYYKTNRKKKQDLTRANKTKAKNRTAKRSGTFFFFFTHSYFGQVVPVRFCPFCPAGVPLCLRCHLSQVTPSGCRRTRSWQNGQRLPDNLKPVRKYPKKKDKGPSVLVIVISSTKRRNRPKINCKRFSEMPPCNSTKKISPSPLREIVVKLHKK